MSRAYTPAFPRAADSAPEVEEMIDVADAATLLKVPKSWIYQHAREGAADALPFVKVGKYTRFYESQLKEWLSRHQGGSRPAVKRL